ncbi:hypothetical protein TRIUR3_06907 [Triticum urartu]|uniref:Uncharacterized protein n=1 Tax=Triticum urartu TaxID=4572 RepID=M8A7Y8_TRIUA|nr:hypothetical protein TRIUR3_06907 [Triticum urartu]
MAVVVCDAGGSGVVKAGIVVDASADEAEQPGGEAAEAGEQEDEVEKQPGHLAL